MYETPVVLLVDVENTIDDQRELPLQANGGILDVTGSYLHRHSVQSPPSRGRYFLCEVLEMYIIDRDWITNKLQPLVVTIESHLPVHPDKSWRLKQAMLSMTHGCRVDL